MKDHSVPSLGRRVEHVLHLRVHRRLAEHAEMPCARCGLPIAYERRNPHPASAVLVPAAPHGGMRGPVRPAHFRCHSPSELQS